MSQPHKLGSRVGILAASNWIFLRSGPSKPPFQPLFTHETPPWIINFLAEHQRRLLGPGLVYDSPQNEPRKKRQRVLTLLPRPLVSGMEARDEIMQKGPDDTCSRCENITWWDGRIDSSWYSRPCDGG